METARQLAQLASAFFRKEEEHRIQGEITIYFIYQIDLLISGGTNNGYFYQLPM